MHTSYIRKICVGILNATQKKTITQFCNGIIFLPQTPRLTNNSLNEQFA